MYRFDDVLVEYQLARPGPGLPRLAAKLDPLAGHPYLLETLRSFVRHGHNRSRVAQDLHVHRNTLDYRLGRITAMTGLDPAVPAQARLLDAALTAFDLRRDPGEGGHR
ncbi:PucR family transcriptional regulator [Dactylosporangium sucinum]|uniref:PucR family transcriptional regulator n=1 Tax=Dactylosporangium sucinum TaxID=1424081 RepID=UPI001E653AEB|nr:helix-turn-helix domain-containing protein [Dactylosporangium sucinum]